MCITEGSGRVVSSYEPHSGFKGTQHTPSHQPVCANWCYFVSICIVSINQGCWWLGSTASWPLLRSVCSRAFGTGWNELGKAHSVLLHVWGKNRCIFLWKSRCYRNLSIIRSCYPGRIYKMQFSFLGCLVFSRTLLDYRHMPSITCYLWLLVSPWRSRVTFSSVVVMQRWMCHLQNLTYRLVPCRVCLRNVPDSLRWLLCLL